MKHVDNFPIRRRLSRPLGLISLTAAILVAGFSGSLLHAEGPSVSVTGVPADQESTITIRKGSEASKSETDYRIESGTEEINGDPVAGQEESYKSWKAACNEWKKDMREMNGKALIALSCGTPHGSRDSSSRVTQSSSGSYKLKVRVREAAPGTAH